MKQSIYMPFYIGDFLTSTMSWGADEIGAYLLLLSEQWQNGYVPAEPAIIERVARCEYGRLSRVLGKFQQIDGNLINRKCDEIRTERLRYLEKKVKAGKAGAGARWGDDGTGNGCVIGKPDGKKMAQACRSSSSSSSSLSPLSSSSSEGTGLPIRAPGNDDDDDGNGEGTVCRSIPELVSILSSTRPEYQRIPPNAWHNAMKAEGATMHHLCDAATRFIQADANQIEPLRAPAVYFARIVRSVLEDAGIQTETHAERMERLRKEG